MKTFVLLLVWALLAAPTIGALVFVIADPLDVSSLSRMLGLEKWALYGATVGALWCAGVLLSLFGWYINNLVIEHEVKF